MGRGANETLEALQAIENVRNLFIGMTFAWG